MTNETKFNMRDKIAGTIAAEVLSTLNIDGMGPWNAADKIIAAIKEEQDVLLGIAELDAKLAKALRLMELSVELATWSTTMLDDVILFITELKGGTDG